MRGANASIVSMPIVNPLFYVLTATSVLCACLIVIRAERMDYVQYQFLLWNLFLAWLPLLFSMTAVAYARIVKGGTALATGLAVLGVGWLLLFPNAPYLTTDLIHLIFNDEYRFYNREEDLLVWYDLVLFFLFSWCGLLLGYQSARHFHSIVVRYGGAFAGWLFVIATSYLGGFGVYLGRVVRLNSWDVVFSPFRLIEGVLEGINRNAFVFTLLFGTMILIIYVSLYMIGSGRVRALAASERYGGQAQTKAVP
ncbi:DUF1361 domain-containing protein [Cohnella suwonensis]|uniref:DUF1361 domain-containing protein n=1 Tax=Cohnella suwonensis TaxID=696072 RepID=A0ABW0LTP3_9BACL